jgi:hypothetical protein
MTFIRITIYLNVRDFAVMSFITVSKPNGYFKCVGKRCEKHRERWSQGEREPKRERETY